jgi:hypothetical protein
MVQRKRVGKMIKTEGEMEITKSRFEEIHREIFGIRGSPSAQKLEIEAVDLMNQMIDYRGCE